MTLTENRCNICKGYGFIKNIYFSDYKKYIEKYKYISHTPYITCNNCNNYRIEQNKNNICNECNGKFFVKNNLTLSERKNIQNIANITPYIICEDCIGTGVKNYHYIINKTCCIE